MINVIISGIVTVLSLLTGIVYLKFNNIKVQQNIKSIFPKNKKQVLFGMGMIVSLIIVFFILNLLYDRSWLFSIKRIILCAALWPIALIDFRKHIIPNNIILFLVIVRGVVFIPEFIIDFKSAKVDLFSCVIAGVAITVILCIMRFLVKDGIGYGDIKLFAVIGLYLGISGCISTIFLSFVCSFVISIFMLITKRKNKKDQIAFAPSILIGTLLSVILFGA